MQPKTATNIGIDNKATVEIGSCIIKHHIEWNRTNLYEANGAIRLGGTISKFHRPSPFSWPWERMKNGDIWKFFWQSVTAKGAWAVRLTKVKGHATQEMVDEGTVPLQQKEGNDGADGAADSGAVDMQDDLAKTTNKYAYRQWRYKKFIARVQSDIVYLRKAANDKLEKFKKQEHPFEEQGQKKITIPLALRYADNADRMGTEKINTRKVEPHDETNIEERKHTEKVRCFIDNVRWKDQKEKQGGITWIELYILYILHGGGRDFEQKE